MNWSSLSPEERLAIFGSAALSLLMLASRAGHVYFPALNGLGVLYLLAGPSFPALKPVRLWQPALFTGLFYLEVIRLLPFVRAVTFDAELAAFDRRWFGGDPSVLLESVTFPALTEFLQIVYASFYFIPISLLIHVQRRDPSRFHFAAFLIMFGFFVSYAVYFFVPAEGPRFFLAAAQTRDLTGIASFTSVRALLDLFEGRALDCFPSGHTMMSILTTALAWKYRKRRLIYTAWTATLIFSTVYLRYHYVADLIAGALLAAILWIVSPWIRKLVFRKFDTSL